MVESVRGYRGYSGCNNGQMEESAGDQVQSMTARAGTPLISIQLLWAREMFDQENGMCPNLLLAGSRCVNICVSNMAKSQGLEKCVWVVHTGVDEFFHRLGEFLPIFGIGLCFRLFFRC
jgi:hypothetical protein